MPGCEVQGYLLRRQRILAAECAGSISSIQASEVARTQGMSLGVSRKPEVSAGSGPWAFHARREVHTVSEQAVLDPLVRTNVPAGKTRTTGSRQSQSQMKSTLQSAPCEDGSLSPNEFQTEKMRCNCLRFKRRCGLQLGTGSASPAWHDGNPLWHTPKYGARPDSQPGLCAGRQPVHFLSDLSDRSPA